MPLNLSKNFPQKATDLKIGIGITTFNRSSILKETIEAIKKFTETESYIFVSDDGSSDDTLDIIKTFNVDYLSVSNRGIAWNKNRVLYYLLKYRECDIIILLEDDTRPTTMGWEKVWIDAVQKYGHVNLAPLHWPNEYLQGEGTVDNPFISIYLTGQCSAFSRRALADVGFMDTRFRRYGFEHVDHTNRFIRAGYGGIQEKEGEERLLPYLIHSNLEVRGLDKGPDYEGISFNSPIYKKLAKEEIYRHAWRGDEEAAFLRYEMFCIQEQTRSTQPPPPQQLEWEISTFNGEKIYYSPEYQTLRGKRIYPDMTEVQLQILEEGMTLTVKIDHSKHFLIFKKNEVILHTKNPQKATIFSISYTKKSGFGLHLDRKFLCYDITNEEKINVTRENLSEWETFFFLKYAIPNYKI
ncbi:hypothetical protein AA0472_3016 [Acetobacter estunensis NRIC 0472]|nr:glycosyltransferase [Acetobacter estunensis]GBQ29578.1 hypothetical protein AA0472_3016 [Acetobacter estunensis NRIC 0472]